MRYLLLVMLCLNLVGCAAGAAVSATSGYAMKAGTSDDLSSKARSSILEDAFKQCKEYVDSVCGKK